MIVENKILFVSIFPFYNFEYEKLKEANNKLDVCQVEHFLGIKRRAETGNGSTQKKPKI